jgi:hypothetical protein
MKAQVEVVLEGNIRLPLSCKMDSLRDVAAMGGKLTKLARDIKRVMPDTANAAVKGFKVSMGDK